MSSWRDEILKEFAPNVARLTLVADPDGLLLEEKILEGIRERGFELIPLEDHIAFRYVYELKYRSNWDRGEQTDLVVVLHSPASDLNSLPFDLLQAGRRLSFNLGDIFPNLSYPLVTALDRGDLDALYEAQMRHAPGQLGDNATKEFVLRHVFEIAPELIKKPSDLLRVMLRRHYAGRRIPKVLNDRFIQILRQNDGFVEWPLETIVPDREAFFAFLQERWPLFLDRIGSGSEPKVREKGSPYGLKYSGPLDLPFDHHDIKVYIDNLFVEGALQPIPHEYAATIAKTWAIIGVRLEPKEDRSRRIARLIAHIRTTIPSDDTRYGDWLLFSRGWAELVAAGHEDTPDSNSARQIEDLQAQVDKAFTSWLARRYEGLINLPPSPPVMLHHLLRFLARSVLEDKSFKAALLVIDGLSMDQWIVLREAVASQRPDVRFRENVIFAWAPTLTSVSRQSIFSGKPPILFPNSIQTTEKEPALWSQFWADQGLAPNEIAYAKGLGDGNLTHMEELLSHQKVRVAGLVIDKVDRIMHGMELGTAGMQNQVRQWGHQGYMASLLDLLLERDFRIFVTSDHGNVEARGCGRPAEGSVADIQGERVRIYSNSRLRRQVNERFPDAIEWPPIGLPDDYLPLFAPNRKAFVREEDSLVCHGGVCLEELIVPLVQIDRIDT
jgi:hypothetical protein